MSVIVCCDKFVRSPNFSCESPVAFLSRLKLIARASEALISYQFKAVFVFFLGTNGSFCGNFTNYRLL